MNKYQWYKCNLPIIVNVYMEHGSVGEMAKLLENTGSSK
jgi:hypothetical protein